MINEQQPQDFFGLHQGPVPLPQSYSHLCAKLAYGQEWTQRCTSGAIEELLSRVDSDDQLAQDLAAHSYRHENGFIKLLLLKDTATRFHIRLHLWTATPETEQNIHDHRFDFWSFVLNGKMTNHVWNTSSLGREFTHYRYDPRGNRSEYMMHCLGTERLIEDATFSIQQGRSYFFDNSWLHTISCEPETVTLLLEDRRRLRSSAHVFTERFQDASVSIASPQLSLQEYRQAVRRAFSYLH